MKNNYRNRKRPNSLTQLIPIVLDALDAVDAYSTPAPDISVIQGAVSAKVIEAGWNFEEFMVALEKWTYDGRKDTFFGETAKPYSESNVGVGTVRAAPEQGVADLCEVS